MLILFVWYQKQIPKTQNSNNHNYDHQSSQQDLGTITNNPEPFTVNEQDVIPLSSPTNKIAPAITSNVNTPSPKNKSNILFEEN